jgi:CheY-like chemotaxis protein
VALVPPDAAPDDAPGRVVAVGRPPTERDLVDAAVAALDAARRASGAAPADAGPASDDAELPAADAPAQRPEMRVVEGGAISMNAVLAETNEVNRIVLRAFLEKAGFTPHLAANGFEAVKLFKELRPSLLIVATSMPTMNGLEAAKAIRRHETEINARPSAIIGLTEPGREGEHERCTAAGMNDSIAKPVRLEELGAKIERWTALHRPADETRSAAG